MIFLLQGNWQPDIPETTPDDDPEPKAATAQPDELDELLENLENESSSATKQNKRTRTPGLAVGALDAGKQPKPKAAKKQDGVAGKQAAQLPEQASAPRQGLDTAVAPEEILSASGKKGKKKEVVLDPDMTLVSSKHMAHGGTSSKALQDLTVAFFLDDANTRHTCAAKIRGAWALAVFSCRVSMCSARARSR